MNALRTLTAPASPARDGQPGESAGGMRLGGEPTPAVAAEKPAADAPVLTPQDVVVATPQSLTSKAAAGTTQPEKEDKDWGKGAKAAAIIAGVVGGALIAGTVATLCASGGMQLGGVVMGSLYREGLPRAIGLIGLANTSNQFLLAAPLAGAVAGGIVGSFAGKKKHVEELSDVPGSGLGKHEVPADYKPLGTVSAIGRAFAHQFQGAGEAVHENVNGLGDAENLMGAVKSGAGAGYAFGSRLGNVGGRVIGVVQGAYLGGLLAGMPFSFAPMVAIPVAILGAWGISTAMSKVGGVAAGTVAGAGGAVVGAVAHGIGKAVGKDA